MSKEDEILAIWIATFLTLLLLTAGLCTFGLYWFGGATGVLTVFAAFACWKIARVAIAADKRREGRK